MFSLQRLFKVGSMAESLGVYVPAMVFQKALGLGRFLLLAYLMKQATGQYGLWAASIMVFTLAAPVLTLGSNQGLVRYVSFYEARGQLRQFYRRVRWGVLVCVLATGAAVMSGSGLITRGVLVPKVVSEAISYADRLQVCWVALANAILMALYYNMIAMMVGLRAYRLVSAVEIFFGVVFTILAAGLLLVRSTAIAVLIGHLAALVGALVIGMILLEQVVRRICEQSPRQSASTEAVSGIFRRILRFSVVAVAGNFLWLAAQYVSFYLVYREHGEDDAGAFSIFLQLTQLVLFLANAAWAVIFTHVAKLWESGQKPLATLMTETVFKAVAMTMMTLTVLLYATSPMWVRLLPQEFRHGLEAVGGLLMFFQVVSNITLLTVLANLHERPIVIALAAAATIAVNAVLALWWMPSGGLAEAGLAAGVGAMVGAGVVAVCYFFFAKLSLHPGTLFIFACPVWLVLPLWVIGPVWAAVLLIAVQTNWLFSPRQKSLLASFVRRVLNVFRGIKRWR